MVHEIHGRHEKDEKILFKEESYRILGACFEVYKEKGCGFHEPLYQECLRLEFALQGISAIEKPIQQLEYKGVKLSQTFIPDFVCFRQIIVELKALPCLLKEHEAQVRNYLKATGMPLGLLVNFGHYPRIEHLRFVANDKWSQEPPDLQA